MKDKLVTETVILERTFQNFSFFLYLVNQNGEMTTIDAEGHKIGKEGRGGLLGNIYIAMVYNKELILR